ncbi:MAG: sigma-70 family RNA polymerase sigma factor [Prochloraceae cyanobacterium]|nr:sigma-70 family RNA polymerase sigma factor [Prochloraceae cyanobacterium]
MRAERSSDPCGIDSIDRTVGKEEETTIGDFLTSDEDSIEDNLVYNLLKQDLNNILDTLTPKEAEVIRMRYGFDDGNFKSFQKIGEKINLTRERIRQIEIKAIRKLRCQNHTIKLKDYIF